MININEFNTNQELAEQEQVKTDTNMENESEASKEATTDMKKINEKQTAEDKENKTYGVCILTYVAGGIWTDQKGVKWSSNAEDVATTTTERYNIDEYNKRLDLKFMVRYGSMTLTTV